MGREVREVRDSLLSFTTLFTSLPSIEVIRKTEREQEMIMADHGLHDHHDQEE